MDKTLIILGILLIVGVGVTAVMVVTTPAQESPIAVPPAPGNPVHPNDPTVLQNDKLAFAKQFVMDDATFQFDGMAETLAGTMDDGKGTATVEFTSRHAGYGNRTGMVLAEVLTPHTAVVQISGNQITSAVMDNTWDMIAQKNV